MGLDLTGEEIPCLDLALANLKQSGGSDQNTGFTQMPTIQDFTINFQDREACSSTWPEESTGFRGTMVLPTSRAWGRP